MLFLPVSKNILQTGTWNFPPNQGKPAALYDGFASKKVTYVGNSFQFSASFSWGETATLIAIAGYTVNRTLTVAEFRGQTGQSSWGPYTPLTIDGTTAYGVLPAGTYTAYGLRLQTGVPFTEMEFGEIMIGSPFEAPEPYNLTVKSSTPTIINGDFAVQVGVPLQTLTLDFRPQDSRAIFEMIRNVGSEAGLLVVDNRPYFGRFDPEVSYTRTTEHNYFEGISLTFNEMEGNSIWQ